MIFFSKKNFKNFFVFLFSIIFIFLVLELFIIFILGDKPRDNLKIKLNEKPIPFIEDEILGWKPKPGKFVFSPWSIDGEKTTLTNLKDGSRLTGNVDKKNKIIFVGGSLTQGWAVSDDENYPALLQNKIKNYKIKNYGVGGYGGTQSFLKLKNIFEVQSNVKLVIYGFIPHHEIRNIAAGSWMYLLKQNSKGTSGELSLPYASIKNNKIIIKKPKKYLTLPFGNKSALITKIEKRILKIESFQRSREKTKISKKIILNMNEIAKTNKAKFMFLFLNADELPEKQFTAYKEFLENENIVYIECQFPLGKKYIVTGEGHPNKMAHKSISECVHKKLSLTLDKL